MSGRPNPERDMKTDVQSGTPALQQGRHQTGNQTLSSEFSAPNCTKGQSSRSVPEGQTNRITDVAPLPDPLRPQKVSEMPTRYDHTNYEASIYRWWEQSGFFKPEHGDASRNIQDEKVSELPPFVICMPPPNVTGSLHMGHALGTTLQDIMVRFQRMKGRPTLFLPGTDHAGIATQLQVEKAMAKDGLRRTDVGRDKFLDMVWNWKNEKGDYICEQMRRLGASCDWSRHRFTLETDISAAVCEAFVTLHERGLIYRGEYMVNWSPNLMTAVSDLEVEFSEEKGSLYYFKYPLSSSSGLHGEFIPVATTRPETIIGDTAVCVHPEDPRYKHLVGKTVTVPVINREIPVIADEYVDPEFGTGALKITPGHDVNDYALGKRHSLPIIGIMNKDASINAAGGPLFEGLDRFEARSKIWSEMEKLGLVIKVEDHINRVPRSQRGGEIIEPLLSTQWFIKMESLSGPALQAVRDGQIKILPERFEKIYYNWLEGIHDWCISRQLWWGHRIPVWHVKEKQDEYIVARNEQEAVEKANYQFGRGSVTLVQDEDVLDTWFSSGLWPFATMGWPNPESSDYSKYYPGSVMETGYDILFFWVSRMIMMGLGLTGKVPFETVYLHGLVRDGSGRKMSKTLGNVIDPVDTIQQFGTDAIRYALVTGTTPGQDVPLSMEKIEASRNFANKLWNACRYSLSNLDNVSASERRYLATMTLYEFGGEISVKGLALPERYIISKLHLLVSSVTDGLNALEFGDVGRRIYEFLWDEFADWYVEVSKSRLYGSDEVAARSARSTLVYVQDVCLRLLHPFMPFVTEALWHRFPRDNSSEISLICARWPTGGYVDHEALRRFERIQTLIRSVRNARAEYLLIPSKKIPLMVRADVVTAEDILAESVMIGALAKLDTERLDVAVLNHDGNHAGVDETFVHLIVAEELEAFLPMKGMLDVDKEKTRLTKQLAKIVKDLETLEKRLNAPGFADKAPAAVVATTHAAATDLREQVGSLERRITQVETLRDSA